MERRTYRKDNTGVFIEMLVVFCMLVSLGFPGNFTEIYGEKIGTLLEYAGFGLELLVMIMSSGKTWQDVQLLHLDKKYTVLYCYVVFLFAESMLTTNYPSEQAITCTRLLVTLFFVIWMQERFPYARMLELISIAQGLFIGFTLLFMVRYPGLAYESGKTFFNALRGLYASKNAAATELTFGILVVTLLIREKQRTKQLSSLWYVVWLLHLLLILMCQTTGGFLSMVCTLLVVLLADRFRVHLGMVYIIVNVLFLFAMLTMMPYFQGFFLAMGKDPTLTGRIPLWEQIIKVMQNNKPLLGFGYGMFWRDDSGVALIHAAYNVRINSFFATIASGAHNVIMEMWLNSGLLGIAAFFITLLRCFRDSNQLKPQQYSFCCALMTFLTLNGLTERCLGGNYDFRTVALLLALSVACNREEPERKPWLGGKKGPDQPRLGNSATKVNQKS